MDGTPGFCSTSAFMCERGPREPELKSSDLLKHYGPDFWIACQPGALFRLGIRRRESAAQTNHSTSFSNPRKSSIRLSGSSPAIQPRGPILETTIIDTVIDVNLSPRTRGCPSSEVRRYPRSSKGRREPGWVREFYILANDP